MASYAVANTAKAPCGRRKPSYKEGLEQAISRSVAAGQLVVRTAAVCKSLRAALLGPDSRELWSSAAFQDVHVGLASKPDCSLAYGLADLGARNAALRWRLAHSSQGLRRLLASRGVRVSNAVVWGGGWTVLKLPDYAGYDIPELRQALASLFAGSGGALHLVDLGETAESVYMASISHYHPFDSVTHLGCHPLNFPCASQLRVIQLGTSRPEANCLFRQLKFHPRLQSLCLELRQWRMTAADMQKLATWHPRLQRLSLRLTVNRRRRGKHDPRALSRLPATTQISLCVVANWRVGRSLAFFLLQLRHVQVDQLLVQCPSCVLDSFAEWCLAQCNVHTRLTLCLQGSPGRRLQDLPDVPEVVYVRDL